MKTLGLSSNLSSITAVNLGVLDWETTLEPIFN